MKAIRRKEYVKDVYRRHPASLVAWIVLVAILLVVPGIFSVPLFASGRAGRWVFGILLFVPIMIAFQQIVQWYGTTATVTSDRLLIQTRMGFFHHELREIPYENVGQVTVDRHGIMAYIFRYGSLRIRTIDGMEVILHAIANPEDPATFITQRLASQREYFNEVDSRT